MCSNRFFFFTVCLFLVNEMVYAEGDGDRTCSDGTCKKGKTEKVENFFKVLQYDKNLYQEFLVAPTLVLQARGIITATEAEDPRVQDLYTHLAARLKSKLVVDHNLAQSFWSDAACWSCKVGLGAGAAAAVAAATVATGGADIPALASAFGISEAAAAAAVGGAGASVTTIVGNLLTKACGDC